MSEPAIDLETIFKILPHRYPLLLVDRVLEMDPCVSIHAIKNVTVNEPHFNGHFPGKPIMPGVLIIEALAQASALMVSDSLKSERQLVYFMTIDNARFRKPVIPGDVLHLHVEALKNRRNVWKCQAHAEVDGQKVAEAVLSAMISEDTAQ